MNTTNIQPDPISVTQDLYEYRGVTFDGFLMPKHRVEAIGSYDDVRADDVIVCTYPKAGTHWVGNIALKIMHDGDLKKAELCDLGDIAYEIEPPKNLDYQKMSGRKLCSSTIDELSRLPSPRIIGTHLHFEMLPAKVQDGQAKVIYVCRDPRDITVSMWHQAHAIMKTTNRPELPWELFLESCMQGGAPLSGWSKHFRSYQEVRSRTHVLFLYYELMKEDLRGTVKAIAKFLGKELSDDKLDGIADSCTFEAVKEAQPSTSFLRKGIAGGWKTQFTVSQSERFDAHMDKEITDLELDIPYWPHSPIKVDSAVYPGKTYKYQGKLF